MNPALAASVRRHALGWLVATNAVGLWLAASLCWPELGDLAAPLTYGRWMPVHLDGQLYGWCALPLVGALFAFLLRDERDVFSGRLGLWFWTSALAFATVSWLAGRASGKLFLDFAGAARWVWSTALLGLWCVLARAWWRQRAGGVLAVALLALLLAVPFVLFWAENLALYPAVNPHSGGATGASLLGSTLALLVVFGLLPRLLDLPAEKPDRLFWPAMALCAAYFAGMRHTHASHHEIGQIIGLSLLVAWVPLVVVRARAFRWSEAAQPWWRAAFWWWAALVADGLLTFLPGWSERLKFTNALVAHSHLAMAGLVTSAHGAILASLGGTWRVPRWALRLWQGACVVHVAALLWLGWQEAADPMLLQVRGGVADWAYGLRFAAGLAMFAASVAWLRAAWQHDEK